MLPDVLLCVPFGDRTHRLFVVSKVARPTSTVLPFARSSSFVSMMYARYQLSRFRSFASRSNFSMVRLSTLPVRNRMLPASVDLPASALQTRGRESCDRHAKTAACALRHARGCGDRTDVPNEHNIEVVARVHRRQHSALSLALHIVCNQGTQATIVRTSRACTGV